MQEHISVLFCEDSTDDFLLMKLSLQHLENPVLCERVQQTEALRDMLQSQLFDLYILDYDIPGYHIYDFLDIIKSYDSDASVIVVSGTITEEQVMKALERGASDYVMKDNLQRLPYAVRNEFINSRTRRSLKTSREKAGKTADLLRVYLENVDDVICTKSTDGTISYVSPSCKDVFGISDEELVGKSYMDFVHPDDLGMMREFLEKMAGETGGTRSLQYRFHHGEGYFIWLETKARLVVDRRMNSRDLICTSKNITKVKNAEQALAASEKRFKVLIENSTDIFSLLGDDGNVQYHSPAFYALTGFTEREALNKSGFEFIHVQDRDRMQKQFNDALDYVGTMQLDAYRFRTADGRFLYFESKINNQLEDPDINAVVVSTRDITKRVLTEQQVAYQEDNIEKLSEATIGFLNLSVSDNHYDYIGRQLTDIIPHSVVVVNRYNEDDNVLVCESLFGIEPLNKSISRYATQISKGTVFTPNQDSVEELRSGKLIHLQQGLYKLLFGMYPKRVCDYVQDIVGIRDVYSMGLVWKGKLYGNVVIIAFEKAPRVNTGVIQAFVSVASVALQRKQSEDVLLHSLQEKEVMLKEIHHRVKNNLQIVSSLLELQTFQLQDPAVRLLFSESQTRVRSMAMVHEKIYQSDDLASINYNDYLEQLITYLFESYMPKNVKPVIEAENIMVNIDTAVPLGIIVNELVTNSLKYAFPNGNQGSIYITMRDSGDKLELVVEDNGVGLPEAVKSGNSSTLGLELVHALVQQLDGEIAIESREGTRFTILVDN